MARDDWFRTTDWNAAAEREFERRLGRARSDSRPQYLRIQGVTLLDAGALADGRKLLARVVADYPDDIQVAGALEALADSYRGTKDYDDAERCYREVLSGLSRGPGITSGVAALSLAEVLLDGGDLPKAYEADSILADADLRGALFFDVHRFRHAFASARSADALGRGADAQRWANRALVLAQQSSQRELLPHHPGIGKARPSRAQLRQLRRLSKLRR